MRVMRLAVLSAIACAIALSGCAGLQFYSDQNLQTQETGVKFYYPKPYLLVSRTGAKDNPVQVSVIYLPDQSKPIYAKLKSGYGSADLSLAFQNGILTNIGQKTDTKIPETIAALAGMATAAGGLKLGPPNLLGEKPDFTLYEIDNSSGNSILKEVVLPKSAATNQ